MRKNSFLNSVHRNFHIYKNSCTMFLLGLSATLCILGNKFGVLCLILSGLPVIVWVLLISNERKKNDLMK